MASVEPIQCRCEYRTNPLGVDCERPRLSWIVSTDDPGARGITQVAYRIIVADSPDKLARDEGSLWDTGRVDSNQTLHVEYQGQPLISGQHCWWKVCVWTTCLHDTVNTNPNIPTPSAWSEPAVWCVGKLKAGDWQARWIGDGLAAREFSPNIWTRPATYLRTTFNLDKPVTRATAYVTGLGLYEFYLNGQKVGAGVLAPEYTCYEKRIQYSVFDVTSLLNESDNVAGAILGDGWHGNTFFIAPPPPKRPFEGRRGFFLQLEIEFQNGRKTTIVTDENWKCTSDGPILSSTLYDGEMVDARKNLGNWTFTGYDDSKWVPAVVEHFKGAHLNWQRNEPLRVVEELKPIAVSSPEPNVYQFDMGQNMVGVCRLRAKGPAGQTLSIRHAEMLDENSRLYTANLRSARQMDIYIKAADKPEMFTPRFTYHGFRYVEVSGVKEPMTDDDLTGLVICSDARRTGEFVCSDKLINQLMHNIFWTQRANMYSVPTDCPQRDERAGWMGDIQAFAQTAMFNMDMAPFLNKWMLDVRDAQADDGRFADMSPNPGDSNTRWSGVPAWGDAGVFVPWDFYINYADRRLLAEHFEAMRRWIDYIDQQNPNHLWQNNRGHDYNDWLNGDTVIADGWPKTGGMVPQEVFATAFFARSTQIVADTAFLLGNTEAEKHYRDLYEKIRSTFVKTYVDKNGVIQGNTQAGYALALAFNLLDESSQKQVAKNMFESLKPYNGHLSTGIQTTHRFMLELTRRGFHEEAGKIIRLTTFPSWGHTIHEDATTIWERWDGYLTGRGFQHPGMNSFNHWALGSVGEWIWRNLAGINPDVLHPAFAHFNLHPQPIKGLSWAIGNFDSIRGRIVSDWKIQDGRFHYNITIPANTTVDIILPGAIVADVMENGAPLKQSPGLTQIQQVGDDVHCMGASGNYIFTWPIQR
ncbi:MAG: family 78 glycoside hydrolase catalytic domain [Sedimentisphaerales bacterium]|nr:family 78 glycoside hydrolase catalytic domain [Sedimentisphaerales bacterium]